MRWVAPKEIRSSMPFNGLFDVSPFVVSAIKENMETNGFDPSKPIDVWKGQGIIVDGHTRLQAALQAGISKVAIYEHDFDDEDGALAYAIHNQRDRRNLTDAEIARCLEALDRRKPRGRKNELAPYGANLGKSSEETAKLMGIPPRQVERTRTVLAHGGEETKQAVRSGEKSINKAYQETQERRRQEAEFSKPEAKPVFNRTNENIKWAHWSWNPVTGCLRGCSYCYARDIANRFYPQKFEPFFHEERLAAPQNTLAPKPGSSIGDRSVFVCSMGDLFAKWIPQEWIDAVLFVVRESPQWNFLFLTKSPKRMIEIDWPNNAWVGTTVDVPARVKAAEAAFAQVKAKVRFLSCEPLREKLTFSSLEMFDWVIVGGQSASTGEPAMQPEWEWFESLFLQARHWGKPVFCKDNLDLNSIKPEEYPKEEGQLPLSK